MACRRTGQTVKYFVNYFEELESDMRLISFTMQLEANMKNFASNNITTSKPAKVLKEQRRKDKLCYTCGSDKYHVIICPKKSNPDRGDSIKKQNRPCTPKILTVVMATGIAIGSSLTIPVHIQTKPGLWMCLNALVDSKAELNFISQLAIKELGYDNLKGAMKAITTLDSRVLLVYRECEVLLCITDLKDTMVERNDHFYAIDI
ncbi:MAG: hypothetical protein M1840_006755 [Geoglossum simile]|nr:MAG: hypothetical protein M1840_006755 [Geoglossum simile]